MFQLAGWPKLESDGPLLKGRNRLKLIESKRFKKQKLNMSLQSTPPLCGAKKVNKRTFLNSNFKQKNHLSFSSFLISFFGTSHNQEKKRPTENGFGRSRRSSVASVVGRSWIKRPSKNRAYIIGRSCRSGGLYIPPFVLCAGNL